MNVSRETFLNMAYVSIPKIRTTDGVVNECALSYSADTYNYYNSNRTTATNTFKNNTGFVEGAFDITTIYNSLAVNESAEITTISPSNVKLYVKREGSQYGSFFLYSNDPLSTIEAGGLMGISGYPSGYSILHFYVFFMYVNDNSYTIAVVREVYVNRPAYGEVGYFWRYDAATLDNVSAKVSAIITGAIPPEYTWSPFIQLSGNNGQFLLNLSTINASIIGDGDTLVQTSDASKFYINSLTSLFNIGVNMLDGEETIIAYCGRNYLTLTKRTVSGTLEPTYYYTLKFYFRSDVRIYTSPEVAVLRSSKEQYLSIIYDSENEVAALDLITTVTIQDSTMYWINDNGLPSDEEMRALYIWLQDNGQEQEYITPYDTGTTDNGGNPTLPRPQDHITDSPTPACGGLDTGIVTLYRPTPAQVEAISDYLWSDTVLENFKKYFNNFADNIMSLYSLPFTPANLPTKAFTVGKMTSETITNVEYCTLRYFDIDMGELELKPRWSSYLDYSPYTKCELYLPYLGLHSLDVDELMSPTANNGTLTATQGCTLKLIYRLDILTGVIVAKLKVNGEIRYQFSGKVGTNIPLTGQIYNNLIGSIVTAGAGLIGTIATGGLTAPMTVPAAVTATVQAQKPAVTRIGNISGDASMLATNVPYLCITSPNKPLLEQQEDFTGFPSYKSGTLSNFSGYTQVLDAHVEGISCTEDERNMILSYLKNGVII